MGILAFILTIVIVVSPIAFIVGLITTITASNPERKKFGIQLLAYSVISFVIGFGGCMLFFSF